MYLPSAYYVLGSLLTLLQRSLSLVPHIFFKGYFDLYVQKKKT